MRSGIKPRERWPMLESRFYNKLATKLKKAGWFVQKIHQGRFGQGFPDCVLIDPDGVVIFCELKVGNNKLSALQKKKLEAIANQGACAIVGRYSDGATFEAIGNKKDEESSWSLADSYCPLIQTIWEEKKK